MNLSVKKVEANRNFANKIWNAGRFVISAVENAPAATGEKTAATLADGWITARLAGLVSSVDRLFASHQYGKAGRQIYDFFWSEFADWYIEISKQQLSAGSPNARQTAGILATILDTCLRLLHPFTPFVTEQLWGYLKLAALERGYSAQSKSGEWEDALMIARWPDPSAEDGEENKLLVDFELIMELVKAIRNLRTDNGIAPVEKISATIIAGEKSSLVESQKQILVTLARLDPASTVIQETVAEKPESNLSLVIRGVEVFVPVQEKAAASSDRTRLKQDLTEAESQIERLEKLLAGDFAKRAPANLVEKERAKLGTFQETADKLRKQLQQ
jgi:valyl-tRNA synthetase